MAVSSSSLHLTPASSSCSYSYDIFISFRGEDTRKKFVDHLCSAFKQHTINIFKDDETLRRGESISPSLFKAIEESKIALIVLSKNYANSSWCLDELAYIMKCRVERGLIVMPIFYDVEPSQVRKIEGNFGKAFAKQEVSNINKAELWRKALFDVSNISGWEVKNMANGHEAQAIKKIVETVFDSLFPLKSNVDEELVGMRDRLQDLESRLDIGSGGVRMVGIWGVGGSGKTTLATSLYMKISQHFQGHCNMVNVREESSKYDLKQLQENILSSIFKREVKVHSIEDGKLKIRSMLCSRKVLVLLDDIDTLAQLDALAGSHDWFGNGSRIIITTRDEHLLRTHQVDMVYHAKLLSENEAIQLFSTHAFKQKSLVEGYEMVSLPIIYYAAGLPLALKVLGSFLYDKGKEEWISTLARLKDIPEVEIVEKLKISYDGLKVMEKELFLDIACFFKGKRTEDAMEILEACGFHPQIGIKVLTQKALITVSRNGWIDMHDLVREMAHHIVRGEHPNNPEKHSRVWKHEEIRNMCFGDATTAIDKIEAITYHAYTQEDSSRFCKIVSNMKKLRYLNVSTKGYDLDHSSCFFNYLSNTKKLRRLVGMHYDMYDGGPNNLSNELRYIFWKNYPVRSPFPDNFQPIKLVVLILEKSKQKEVWKGCKHLPNLKVLHLEFMDNLESTPNFNGLPSLQRLIISSCYKLKKIHSSLENHTSLEHISVTHCYNLRMFPRTIHMENLKTLKIEICFLKDGENRGIEGLSNLEVLSLCGNDFSRLDISLSQLTRLKVLDLSYCLQLIELPELPSSLAILKADYCSSLINVGERHKYCEWLCQVSFIEGSIIQDGDRLQQSMLEGKAIEDGFMVLRLEGVQVAKGFTPCLLRGKRCRLQLSENWCNDFSGFLMCVVLVRDDSLRDNQVPMSDMNSQDEVVWEENEGDNYMTWVWYISFGSLRHTKWWDQTHKAFSFEIEDNYNCNYKECSGFGVRLVAKKSRSGPTETSTNFTSRYTPRFKIKEDSTSALTISLTVLGELDVKFTK